MSNTNLVILPKNQPEPLIEIDLTVDQLEQMLKNVRAGGTATIKVWHEHAELEMR